MPHNTRLCKKQEDVTDSAPFLYGTEAQDLKTCQNSIHTTHNFIIQTISDLIYLVCKSHFSFHTPQRTPTPPSSTIFSYTFHIFLNLVNFPVPALPWPYYKIISVRTCKPYNTHQRILLALNNLKKNNIPTQ